jgi:hypothetical protein
MNKLFIHFSRELETLPKTQKQLRSFGILFGSVLTCLFIFFYYRSVNQYNILLFIGIISLTLSALSPKWLYYPYIVWMSFGITMGMIVNKIVLTSIFYILVAPSAVIYRFLKQKTYNETTFWIKRNEITDEASQNKQF